MQFQGSPLPGYVAPVPKLPGAAFAHEKGYPYTTARVISSTSPATAAASSTAPIMSRAQPSIVPRSLPISASTSATGAMLGAELDLRYKLHETNPTSPEIEAEDGWTARVVCPHCDFVSYVEDTACLTEAEETEVDSDYDGCDPPESSPVWSSVEPLDLDEISERSKRVRFDEESKS